MESSPAPPYFSGTATPRRPSSPILFAQAIGYSCDSSYFRDSGRMSRSANSRTVLRVISCVGESAKSIGRRRGRAVLNLDEHKSSYRRQGFRVDARPGDGPPRIPRGRRLLEGLRRGAEGPAHRELRQPSRPLPPRAAGGAADVLRVQGERTDRGHGPDWQCGVGRPVERDLVLLPGPGGARVDAGRNLGGGGSNDREGR